jgi:putative FmdB family regulatory protein
MALYEYKCSDCEEQFELMRPMSAADEWAECPKCGGTESRRLISSFASVTPGASALSTSNATIPVRKVGGHGCCGGGCCG